MRTIRPFAAALPAAALLALAACSTGATGADDEDAAGDENATVDVLASFYPLLYVVEEVGGDRVSVEDLTPPGADPHSLELSPAQVAELERTDLVVHVPGLQAATDEALDVTDPAAVLDAGAAAGVAPEDLARDPHFWLDPTLVAELAGGVADQLAELDPAHADEFELRAEELMGDLADLDAEYASRLAPCAGATLVTSHEAFGYLADRYGLEQVGIGGIDPEVEPSPARLREVGEIARAEGVRTLFFEIVAGPDVTDALAGDLGVGTDVLDPVESQADAGADYLDVMGQNLNALTRGLACEG
ncbi:MAG: metal ABC transporter substrate-binding protein [Actinomycetaceae bacterium]